MSSVQALREFINERLAAAAGEIFNMFQQTIVQYEEEIDRQRKLLQISCNPQIESNKAELPQRHNCWEEQFFKQEANCCLEQEEQERPQIKGEEPEPPQIKEEEEEPEPPQIEEHQELGSSQEGEQLILKVESDSFRVPSIEGSLSEQEEVADTALFLYRDSEVHDVKNHLNSPSTGNAELKKFNIALGDRVDNVPASEKRAEGEKLLCEETCGKEHKFRQNLGTVTDKKKRICNICGKNFNRQSDLLRHVRTHTGEKPYTCKTCGKKFTQRGSLMIHKRIHTGEKPYSCEICGTKFTQQGSLIAHKRIHTGEKRYSCKICGKRFNRQFEVSVHMRIHTGEKPYSCGICGKRYRQHCSFLYHMKTHTGEKPYSYK